MADDATMFEDSRAEEFQDGRIRALDLVPRKFSTPFTLQGVRITAGATTLEELHDVSKMFTVLEGHATFILDGEEQAVGEGTVVWVKAGRRHQIRNESAIDHLQMTVAKWK